MMRILLAVIVALCAFATPSLADINKTRPHLLEGRSTLDTNADNDRSARANDRDDDDGDDDKRRSRARGSRSGSGHAALSMAERYLGTNPTKMRRLWCANFLGMIEKKAGRSGSGSNFARSYASYGKKVSRSDARPGDIVVMARGKRGGHVGYFAGWADNGKAIVVSGNSRGGKVAKGQYAASRIFAWRRPA